MNPLITHLFRRSLARRIFGATLLAVLAVGITTPGSATTNPGEQSEVRLKVAAQANTNGHTSVTEQFTWDTRANPSTFTRALPLFVPRTETSWRKFEYTNFTVTSPDIDLTLTVTDDAHQLLATIAIPSALETTAEAVTLPAEIAVEFSYIVTGATSAGAPQGDDPNEFYWAPLASGGAKFDALTFNLTASNPASALRCAVHLDDGSLLGWSTEPDPEDTTPSDSDEPEATCTTNSSSGVVRGSDLSALSTVIVRGEFPHGTIHTDSSISVTEPELDETPEGGGSSTDEFDPTWSDTIDLGFDEGMSFALPILALLTLGGVAALFAYFTRERPDLWFPNLTTGDTQAATTQAGGLVAAPTEVDTSENPSHPAAPAPVPRSAAKKAWLAAGATPVQKTLEAAPTTALPQDLPVAFVGPILNLEVNWFDLSAVLSDLAQRGHVQLSFSPPPDDASRKPGSWTFIRLAGEPSADLSTVERTLLDDIFGGAQQFETHSLHSSCAPKLLEVLSLIGHELFSQGLTLSPVDHATARKARRVQRTPIGRAYAEQVAGLKQSFERLDASGLVPFGEHPTPELFVRYLPYAIATGQAQAWGRAFDQAEVAFAAPAWFSHADFATQSFEQFAMRWQAAVV